MRKTVWIALVVLVMAAVVLSACGGGGGSGTKERQEPPADYASATNPFEGQADAATAGQALYTANCVSCHGDDASGNGPAGASLDPKPANLQNTAKETTPAYQHWVVSEGGAAAGMSASMPAFKGALSDDEIWQIVTYLDSTYK